jgi:predicted metal-dependent HD superfamily phosphohydrolase
MTARHLVRQRWRELARRRGIADARAEQVGEEIERAHEEPHRAYHTLDHIAALLQLLDRHGAGASDPEALELAILFHDAVYDPARQDNEAASADLAAARLAELGFPAATVAAVRRLILATRHAGHADAERDAGVALLLDLDLSILAADWETYRGYAQAIRREYARYPDAIYRVGRQRVLEAFLARENIYLTPGLRALWEARARDNLARELTELG